MRLLLILLLTTSCAVIDKKPKSEVIGYYSAGSIVNSDSIDNHEGHTLKLFRNRKNLYGSDELLKAIIGLSVHMKDKHPSIEKVQIGDMSAITGGKLRRHKSHQNGLGTDIVYFSTDEKVQDVNNGEWDRYFTYRGKLSSRFNASRNWEAFKYLVNNHDVGRIFVDETVKNSMCSLAKSRGELVSEKGTLRRLRIENSVHKSHYHLRLKCPENNIKCKPQTEPPTGSGC